MGTTHEPNSRLLSVQDAIEDAARVREFLTRIDERLPADIRARYRALIRKRRAHTLTPEEYTELIRLGDQHGEQDVRRVEALAELARLKGMDLDELMDSLGINAPSYD